MAKIIAVTNQKGGVGKTMTSSALCGCLTAMDKSVLAVDLDTRKLEFFFGCGHRSDAYHVRVFKGTSTLYDVVQHTPTCDVVPSNIAFRL